MSNTFIVYVSDRTDDQDPFLARDIAIESSRNNQLRNVSGVLMGVGCHFLQVLEGEASVLDELLAKIERDPRHKDLKVLFRGKLEERVFGRWSMGCVTASDATSADDHYFDDISQEIERLCKEESEEHRELLKDLLIEIPKRFAENKLSVT